MTTTFGIVVMVVAILVSVMLHEYGHYKTAKLFGMKVTQFFVGFGPTIFSRQRGETEFGIKAYPLGGFVRIVGQTDLEKIDPEDEGRAMWRQPVGRRLVVMSAGSTMHFLIGFVLLFAVFAGFGQYVSSNKVYVSQCIDEVCAKQGPAAAAGLRTGDDVRTIDGIAVADYTAMIKQIRTHQPGEPVVFGVLRDGQPITISAALRTVTHRDAATGQLVRANLIGLQGTMAVHKDLNPISAVGVTASQFWGATTGTVSAIGRIPASIPKLFHPKAKEEGQDRLISVVGAARLGGNAVTSGGVESFLLLVASLNISIGIFNLLPLLPLDGGHIAVILFERVRSTFARWFRRPDPGRVDMLKLFPMTVAFLGFFGMLSVLMIVKDIVNPIANPF